MCQISSLIQKLANPWRIPLLACVFVALMVSSAQAIVDVDQNGWSDIWEAKYGAGLSPDDDADSDNYSNSTEYLAGTDPRDPGSIPPGVEVGKPTKTLTRLEWQTVPGKLYQLDVSFDGTTWTPWGEARVGDGTSMQFEFSRAKSYLTGGPLLSRWLGMPGSSNLGTVKNNVSGQVTPSFTGTLPAFETPQNLADSYGQWIRGWLLPSKTGTYTFSISGDDNCELRLSTNADPAKVRSISSVPGWTSFREWKKYPEQTSASIALKAGVPYYIEAFHKEWNGGDHVSVAWSGPGLAAGGEILAGKYIASFPESVGARLARGENIQYRVIVTDTDSDGDGLTDWEERVVGYDPQNATTTPRVQDIDAIRTALTATNVITVGVAESRGYEKERKPCKFTFFRTGNITPLTIHYTASGTAQGGVDYEALPATVFLPAGQNSVSVEIVPSDDGTVESAEVLSVEITPHASYTVGEPNSAVATIDDAEDLIFVANLRPAAGTKSTGYGTAALRVAGNKLFATFSLSMGGLTTPQTATEVFISKTGRSGAPVWTLEAGQISSRRWEFSAADAKTLEALLAGKLWARIGSTRFPEGELVGGFVRQGAQKKWKKPGPAIGSPARARNEAEAARFLTQATFGPTAREISRVLQLGFGGWLNDQFSKPVTRHFPYVQARRQELNDRSGGNDDGWQTPRQEAWWQHALTAPDQLRQRMAFALSEIFVVSDIGVLDGSHEGITNYYDLLLKHSFGNYRDLLEAVTLSPIMGQYLSMVRNQKPNPTTGSEPDENYAREVMQLFTIGLNQLNPDGTLKLGPNGMPLPTYTQNDIVGLAHVFTGWGYGYDPAAPPESLRNYFLWGARDEMRPMIQYPEFHDLGEKRIIGGVIVPPGRTGEQDLKLALDTLFKHPNVGPFIGRQLIQRFVTSNPSPGYVFRVASAFNNNGQGVRGDLRATLRAVLLDAEARNPEYTKSFSFGKVREPLVRMTHLFRAFKAAPPLPGDSRFFLDLQYGLTSQAALKSPSVFNFFQPGYIQPGSIAAAGLLSPEFQITSETSTINQLNNQHSAIFWGVWTRERNSSGQNVSVQINVSDEVAILNKTGRSAAENQSALLDHLNVLLLNGQMSAGLRQVILDAFAALPSWFDQSEARQAERVKMAIYLIMASPEYAVQK